MADYTWDAQGHPVTMTRNGSTYYYQLNGHGDVVKITDASGNVVASYQYDAWANIISQSGNMATPIVMPVIDMMKRLGFTT